jgi:hypothetical protein
VPPVPGTGHVSVAVPAPGTGFGCWAGAPSAALDEPGEEDRMTTAYATSADRLEWEWLGTVLRPRPGA